mgnify:CR=1 FL=1
MEKLKRGKKGRRGSPETWGVDAHVGARIRTRRMLLGMSQSKLGEALGLTFQQVQKYEHGVNRITAGMLYQLSRTLDVPISFFFDCYESVEGAAAPTTVLAAPGDGESQISRREARMLRLWREAPDNVAEEVLGLLTMIARGKAAVDDDDGDDDEGENDGDGDGDDESADAAFPPNAAQIAAAAEKQERKRRRRRGAAWDPADING